MKSPARVYGSGLLEYKGKGVVARDGIEPPTPAFSGSPADGSEMAWNLRKCLMQWRLQKRSFGMIWAGMCLFRLFDVRELYVRATPTEYKNDRRNVHLIVKVAEATALWECSGATAIAFTVALEVRVIEDSQE